MRYEINSYRAPNKMIMAFTEFCLSRANALGTPIRVAFLQIECTWHTLVTTSPGNNILFAGALCGFLEV